MILQKLLFCIIVIALTKPVVAERDYAKVVNGTIVADNGQLLRGCHSHINSTAREMYSNLTWWKDLRDKAHLNVVRMMAYNSPWWYKGEGSKNETENLGFDLDIAVENAAKAGMYIILDDHSFCCGSAFSKFEPIDFVYKTGENFWHYVAKRYAGSKHVIFEIKNEPDGITGAKFSAHVKSLYKIIRSHAPNTPVITHSPGADDENGLSEAIDECSSGSDPINYHDGKTLIGFHGYGTAAFNDSRNDFKGNHVNDAQKKAGVICTEFGEPYAPEEYKYAQFLEKKKISWVMLCKNELDFGKGTSMRTGFDYEKYPPTWTKDPGAIDMNNPLIAIVQKNQTSPGNNFSYKTRFLANDLSKRLLSGAMNPNNYSFYNLSGKSLDFKYITGISNLSYEVIVLVDKNMSTHSKIGEIRK